MPEEGVGKYYCLKEGRSYTMKLADKHGDGLIIDEGNYTAYLDDVIVFVSDGTLEFEKSYTFIVGTKAPTASPTKAPTSKPTAAPVSQPTPSPINPPVCQNSKETVYVNKKGKKKKCNWVRAGKKLKIRKKRCISKKYSYLGKRIKENCPKACGKFAGKGICKNLFVSPFGKNKSK